MRNTAIKLIIKGIGIGKGKKEKKIRKCRSRQMQLEGIENMVSMSLGTCKSITS